MLKWQVTLAITVIIIILSSLFSLMILVGVATWLYAPNLVVEQRISFGEKLLIPGDSSDKETASKNIVDKNFKEAENSLKKSLKKKYNDPEARIFLNNAKIGSKTSYTIAVSVPISKDIDGSLEILRGVAQAQDEINERGGIKEVPLKVAVASDDNDKKIAKDVATALVKKREVLGVVGHYASGVTIAAQPIYTYGKLVAITPISTSVCLTKTPISNPICSKYSDHSKNSETYVFRTVPSDSATANTLVKYMLQNWNTNKNVAIFYNSKSNYSISLKSEFEKAIKNANGKVSAEFNFYDQSFDATLSVKKAIEKGIQVLMLAADTETLPKALDVVRASKGKKFHILAGDDVYTPSTLKLGNKAVGMVVATFWQKGNDTSSDFVSKSQKLWGTSEVNWRTALAYDATLALITAIKENHTRSGVQKVLLSPKFKTTGASGTIQFLPSGERKDAKVQLVQIIYSKDSDRYIFSPVGTDQDKALFNLFPGSFIYVFILRNF